MKIRSPRKWLTHRQWFEFSAFFGLAAVKAHLCVGGAFSSAEKSMKNLCQCIFLHMRAIFCAPSAQESAAKSSFFSSSSTPGLTPERTPSRPDGRSGDIGTLLVGGDVITPWWFKPNNFPSPGFLGGGFTVVDVLRVSSLPQGFLVWGNCFFKYPLIHWNTAKAFYL